MRRRREAPTRPTKRSFDVVALITDVSYRLIKDTPTFVQNRTLLRLAQVIEKRPELSPEFLGMHERAGAGTRRLQLINTLVKEQQYAGPRRPYRHPRRSKTPVGTRRPYQMTPCAKAPAPGPF